MKDQVIPVQRERDETSVSTFPFIIIMCSHGLHPFFPLDGINLSFSKKKEKKKLKQNLI